MSPRGLAAPSVLALAIAVATPASADDALMRGLLGIGTAVIMNGMQQNQPQPQPQQQPPAYSAPPQGAPRYVSPAPAGKNDPETLVVRGEIQRRLSMLGFDAGTPDGVFGPRTRRAIADFQKSIGRRPTGEITKGEIAILYERTGGAAPPSSGFAGLGTGAPASGGASGGFPKLGGSAAAGGFPALGKSTDAKAASGSGFPTLGAAPENATGGDTKFPAIGGGSGEKDGAAATAFPTLAAPANDPAGSSAFPTLGSGPKPKEAAYPTLGSPPEKDAAAFPAVSTGEAAAAETAEPAMPALGKPDPGPAAAMPSLAEPDKQGAPVMPPLAKPGPAAPEAAVTLADAARQTVYGSVDKLPAVLGIHFGQSAETAGEKLAAAGFGACQSAATLVCKRQTASMTDTVTVWTSEKEGVWAIARSMVFSDPAPADLVTAPFKSAYPELMDASGYRISAGDACTAGRISAGEVEQIVRGLPWLASSAGRPGFDAVAAFAAQCPLILSLSFSGSDMLNGASLVFADLTGVGRKIAADKAEAESAAKAKHKQLSDDLKL